MLETGDNGSGSRVVLMMNYNGDTVAESDVDGDWWVNILFTFISSLRILYKIFWSYSTFEFVAVHWNTVKQSWTYKNTFFLFWHLSVANSSLARNGALWVPSLSMTGVLSDLSWHSYYASYHNRWVHICNGSCVSWRHLCLVATYSLLLLLFFCPFSSGILEHWEEVVEYRCPI